MIASMNPYDNVGTDPAVHLVHDRLCRLAIGYQDDDGRARHRGAADRRCRSTAYRLVADAVAVTRATREHPDVRQGSSVRGAIDIALVARGSVLELRGPRPSEIRPELSVTTRWSRRAVRPDLPGRDASRPRRRRCCRQIWEDHFILPRPRRRLVEEQ